MSLSDGKGCDLDRFIFLAPSGPNPAGKGYQKIFHHRLSLLPAGSMVTILILCPVFGLSKVESGSFSDFSSLRINLVKIRPTWIDIMLFVPRLISGWPLQVLLYRSRKVNPLLNKLNGEVPDARVYVLLSRVFHEKALSFESNLVDFVDSMDLNFRRSAKAASNFARRWAYKVEAKRMGKWDSGLASDASESLVVGKLDKREIRCPKISVVPLGISCFVDHLTPLVKRKRAVVFSGNLNYQPNIEAIRFFATSCLPRLRSIDDSIQFHIVGRGISTRFEKFLRAISGVCIIGEVEDMRTVLAGYPVSVAPMISGSGMQFKILEGLAVGCLIIATEVGAGDIGGVGFPGLVTVNNDGDDFAPMIAKIFAELDKWEDRSALNSQLVEDIYSWKACERRLQKLYWFDFLDSVKNSE